MELLTKRNKLGIYGVPDGSLLSDARALLPTQEERYRWDALLQRIASSEAPAIRVGHLDWVKKVLDGRARELPIPMFEPSPSRPWTEFEDVGRREFWDYLKDRESGSVVMAFNALSVGVKKRSALCMLEYGKALLRGEVPGLEADHEGQRWLEEAGKFGLATGAQRALAWILLQGQLLPRDPQRGLALLQECAGAGDRNDAGGLAWVYRRGLFGIAPDDRMATKWARRAAPPMERLSMRCGLAPLKWLDARLLLLEKQINLDSDFSVTASPWSQQPWA